jgi:hypothetical protein
LNVFRSTASNGHNECVPIYGLQQKRARRRRSEEPVADVQPLPANWRLSGVSSSDGVLGEDTIPIEEEFGVLDFDLDTLPNKMKTNIEVLFLQCTLFSLTVSDLRRSK